VDAFVQTLHSALGRNEALIARSGSASDDAATEDDRAIARELAATLDRAVELGQWELADRIAGQSTRISREHPLLAERLARLRAARGDFETALNIIDACRHRPASMRLLRTVCLLQAGRRHEAHADLLTWARKASAPLQARLILSLMEWDAGHADDASATLQHTLRQITDPSSLAALMLMAVAQDRRHMAGIWAGRLAQACVTHPHRRYFEAMLAAHGFNRLKTQLNATPEAVSTLATELLANEQVIPALAEAQRLGGERQTALLLAGAIERVIDELENHAGACAALATLHEILGDSDLGSALRDRADRERMSRADVLASIGSDGVNFAGRDLEYPREKAA
jgi:hypothetical protein